MSKIMRIKPKMLVSFLAVVLISSTILRTDFLESSEDQPKTYIIPMEDWIRNDDVNTIRLINILLDESVPVYWALGEFTVSGTTYPAGTFYIKTPFITRHNISSEVMMAWLMWQSKLTRVWRIDVTAESFTVNSKQLVLPRIVLFYDKTTYENALVHYLRFRSLGFKIVLANAIDLYNKSWNEPGSVLYDANVFVMPGGSMHYYSFSSATRGWGIGNITEFIKNGGGYVGVCAGATEALQGTGYHYTDIVNASSLNGPGRDMMAWDWRLLQGPLYLKIEQPNHPVMFGYGSNATRPGYGPEPTIYYFGGPAMYNIGYNATVLATYAGPITQQVMSGVNNTWGAAAVVAADYYHGKVVVFGPHPEYPGPTTRLYAQALYYVANVPKPSPFDPTTDESMSETAISERVSTIRSTVDEIKPILEESTRTAAKIVNMRIGDYYHVLGISIDENVLSFCKELYSELNDIQRYVVKFQYEYSKLNILKGTVQNDPQLSSLIEYTQAMISSFFDLTLNLPQDQHVIFETHWSGIGPFPPFTQADEATKFEELVGAFKYANNETKAVLYPCAQEYAKVFQEYDRLRLQNQTAFTPEVNATLTELFQNLTSYWPAGMLWKVFYTFSRTLDVIQYKIAYHVFDLVILADRTAEVISYMEFALATAVGPWNYASAEIQAFLAHPEGAFL
jgi:glutamine amidotransferase-like uncharacterized protein